MPTDSGASMVIVQHLLPGHPGLSAQLFGAYTAMPVQEAVQGTRMLANHVYTAPADKNLGLHQGAFVLSARSKSKNPPLPIDYFFKSLAEQCGAQAIAVVLSGNGADGTAGLEAIAAEGGLVLVQTPETATADSMPESAIATGLADDVLNPAQMPQAITDYINHLRTPVSADKAAHGDDAAHARYGVAGDSKAIQSLIKLMLARRGHDFSGYKRKTLLRRIARRMGLHSLEREADYVSMLKKDAKEVEALFHDLLIGVTDFFRDPQAWEVLETEVIAPLVAGKKRDEALRVWVPGCSTGEEAYSIAMVVLDKLRRSRKQCLVQIFATDTNQQSLDVGRHGQYPASIANRISPQRLHRYFSLSPDQKYYTVSDELRAAVVFGNQNLFSDPPFGRVDMISCRNVLIYLNAAVQKNVFNTFHFALRSEGYLFLGNAESNGGRDDLFKPLSSSWRIFQRVGPSRFQTLQLPQHGSDVRNPAAMPPRTETPSALAAQVAQKLILERFAPASVLVNSQFEALYFCGPTDDYLQRPTGAPTLELLAMVREGLRARLHSALNTAAEQDSPITVPGVLMKQGSQFHPVEITVAPAPKPLSGGRTATLGRCYLVVFRRDYSLDVVQDGGGAEGVLVRHLEQELQTTREDLATSTERFEVANERLRVSSELVLTSNETLRALNEELESSKEELQSYNEEITTVNQQLEAKLHELEVSHNDTQNLLASSDIATICLDEMLRIKWFAPAAQRLFGITVADIGLPLSDVLSAVGDTHLLLSARAVLAGQTVRDVELLSASGRCYMRRILLYKRAGQASRGLIVTYTDITDNYLSAQAMEVAQRDLDETRERSVHLRVLSAALANAEERERRALAKDLHDDLGQLLAVIGLKAAILQKQDMPDAVRNAVTDCAAAVQLANKKMRDIALQLNPPMLDQLGLLPAMQWLAEEMYRLYQMEVVIHDDGTPKPMEPAVSSTLFRALRELLLNVAKHASVAAAEITTAHGDDNTLVVTVSDSGGGLDPAIIDPGSNSRVTGLVGIRERIGYLGGEMTIQSNPALGTSVILKVPLLTPAALLPVELPKQGTP
jgi:two-component system CheB/CheR fusion protein